MKKKVSINATATPHEVSVAMMVEDVKPQIDHLWAAGVRASMAGKMVTQKGHRPRKATQAECEQQFLTDMYGNFWHTELISGIEKRIERRLCYVTELTAVKAGNMYLVTAIAFLMPQVVWDQEAVMQGLHDLFLSDSPITDEHVEAEIQNKRLRGQYDDKRMKLDTDHKEPITLDDTVMAEVTDEYSKIEKRLPVQHIMSFGEKCPPHYREAVVGACVGETVIAAASPEPGQKVTITVRIMALVDAPPVEDAELCEREGSPNMDALRMNVKRELQKGLANNFQQTFIQFVSSTVQMGPIPGAMAYDRAEGMLNHLVDTKGEKSTLKALGVKDLSVALDAILPRVTTEIMRECVCFAIGQVLDLKATEEDFQAEFKKNDMPDTHETRYVTEMDIVTRRVLTYYQSKGTDRGDIKHIITAPLSEAEKRGLTAMSPTPNNVVPIGIIT